MRNLIDERPSDPLRGRLAFSVQWVSDKDLINKNVLDIGCGYGWFEYHALRTGVASIIGIELTETDLRAVREHLDDRRAEFQPGSAIELPFPPESFDTVVAWEVIEHIPRDTELTMMREAFRVLRPGGIFYLSTPHSSFLCNITDPAWWLVGHRHYTKEQLSSFGIQNGFVVEQNFARAGFWTIFSVLDMYFSKWVLRRRPLFYNFTRSREIAEFTKEGGFVNAFVKYRKP